VRAQPINNSSGIGRRAKNCHRTIIIIMAPMRRWAPRTRRAAALSVVRLALFGPIGWGQVGESFQVAVRSPLPRRVGGCARRSRPPALGVSADGRGVRTAGDDEPSEREERLLSDLTELTESFESVRDTVKVSARMYRETIESLQSKIVELEGKVEASEKQRVAGERDKVMLGQYAAATDGAIDERGEVGGSLLDERKRLLGAISSSKEYVRTEMESDKSGMEEVVAEAIMEQNEAESKWLMLMDRAKAYKKDRTSIRKLILLVSKRIRSRFRK